MEHDPVLSGLTTPYLRAVIADLKADHHPFYTLFTHAPLHVVSINLVYDHKADRGRNDWDGDPLCTYCVPYFMRRAKTFHKKDCFTVAFDGGFVVGTQAHFTADIVAFFYKEFLRRECRRSLKANRLLTPSDRLAELCRLSPLEFNEIRAILAQINDELIAELKSADRPE